MTASAKAERLVAMRVVVVLAGMALVVPAAMAQDDDAPPPAKVWVYGPANTPAPVATPGGKVYREITRGGAGATAGETATEYVELAGFGREFDALSAAAAEADRKELLLQYPAINHDFLDEYAKRMNDLMTVDEYEDIWAKVYEEHFSHEELAALVEGKRNQMAGKPSGVSSQLRDKVLAQAPQISGEAHAEYKRMILERSGEISLALFKEHPEWARSVARAR